MKLLDIINEDRALHEEAIELEEMANLHPSDTGLTNVVVWVNGGGDKLQHGPRIKVSRGNKYRAETSSTIPLTGMPRIIGNADLSQDEFAQVIQWIDINRDTILKYANDELTTAEMLVSIKKLSNEQ